MSETCLVSVIVPVYNVEAYLHRCIDSILGQTYASLEILLVDDGSRDGSGRICDSYRERDSRIRVIHKENGGLSSARNAGIDAATGEYLSFVDSDDWIEPDAIETMLACAQKEKVQMVCAGRYDVDSETGEKTLGLCHKRQETVSSEELLKRILLWDNCDSSACDKLFQRELFREYRFPLGRRSEDVAVMYRIIDQTDRVALLDKPIYNYYHRSGSISLNQHLSDSVFHSMESAGEIQEYVGQVHPDILDAARYFRIKNILYTMLQVELAPPEDRSRYSAQRKQCRKELANNLSFIWKFPRFSRKDWMISLLLSGGLYAPAHRLLQAMKGKR